MGNLLLPKIGDYDYSAYLTDGYYLDLSGPARFVEFVEEELIVTIGELEGEKFKLLDWQIYEFIVPVYGVLREDDGLRRFRTAYLGLPRKNGKSGIASSFTNYHLFADGEKTPRVFGMAKDKKQARIVFDEAANQVKASPFLNKYGIPYTSDEDPRIVNTLNNGVYRPLSKESKNKDGLNASASVCDESQALEEKDENIVNLVHSSTSARRQPLELFIGTSGWNRKSFAWRRLYKKAVDIRDGIRKDDSFFGLIYEAPRNEEGRIDWKDPKVWAIANPSLGPIKTEAYMRAEVQNVIDDPTLLNEFLRLELNVWTETNVGGFDTTLWARQAREYTLESLLGRPCFGGLDLSCTTDFTALVLCFPPFKDDPLWYLWPHLWIPQANMAKRIEKDDAPYAVWAGAKQIFTTAGDQVDYDVVKETIDMYKSMFKLKELAFDKHNSTMLVTQLEKSGGIVLVDHRQGRVTMSPAIKDFETLLRAGVLVHPNNQCLNWMYGNTAIIFDGLDNKMIDKKESNDRIDGVTGSIMSASSAIRNGHKVESVYQRRGLRTA